MPRTFFGRYVRLDRSEFWTSTGCVRSAWRKQLQPAGGCCDWRCRRWRTVATVRLPVLSLSGWSAERWWYWCESAIGLWIKTLRPIHTEVITFAFVLSTIMATMLTKQKHKEWVSIDTMLKFDVKYEVFCIFSGSSEFWKMLLRNTPYDYSLPFAAEFLLKSRLLLCTSWDPSFIRVMSLSHDLTHCIARMRQQQFRAFHLVFI